MKDPKIKLTAEILAHMASDRYENWDILLQRWATILKNSEDYDIKKVMVRIQFTPDTENRECYRCVKVGHLSKDSKVKNRVKCAKCGKVF